MTQTILPTGFEDLSLCLGWNLPTADERQRKRQGSGAAELRTFYDRMLPRLSDALAEVDRFPLGALPESHHALYNLALSLAEVAPHIELYSGSPGVPYAFEEARFVAVHGGQETWRGLSPMATA
ncbi:MULTISPECIES: hypothetical protein [unclassified Sphingobium]|uniref:hypothetical protein n=1 Tax=unclassified Sphingobium TaxID=2611147 RepID=UPI0007700831|nr:MULTISPECIES: hypothetical protein [unclassified Sphingobium]AMK25334.1 hypothetical protein K426_22134 [Sphingobium sp. TKS]NML87989.1 hypothetical protein [Sphingobium sp. TB-6]